MAIPSIGTSSRTKAKLLSNRPVALSLALILFALIWFSSDRWLASLAEWLRVADPIIYWVAIMAVMILILGLIGRATTQRWFGVLIDSSNTASLSRLQVTLWTILVLSSYLMLAIPRIFGALLPIDQLAPHDTILQECLINKPEGYIPTIEGCGGGALQITFPPQVLIALGISLASFAGSRLIQTSNSNQAIDLASVEVKTTNARKKREDAQQDFDEKDQLSKQAQLDFTNAQDAYTLAEADVQNPPVDANIDELKNNLKQAKLLLDSTQAAYQKAIHEKNLAQLALNSAHQNLDRIAMEESIVKTQAEGLLYKNVSIDQARWSDIFRGNQISNYQQTELGKIQMFFFTIVVLLAYAAAIAALLRSGPALLHPLGIGFPSFSESLNGLLAFSHGTYLVKKSIKQS